MKTATVKVRWYNANQGCVYAFRESIIAECLSVRLLMLQSTFSAGGM